jgi:hyaluronan synthase
VRGFERIEAGCRVEGLDPEGAVEILSVESLGDGALRVTYTDALGRREERLLWPWDTPDLVLVGGEEPAPEHVAEDVASEGAAVVSPGASDSEYPEDDIPHLEIDRRVHKHAREDYQSRRREGRFRAEFPVDVSYEGGAGSQEATVRNLSDGGMLIENVELPPEVSEVALRFNVPPGTLPEEYVHDGYRAKAHVTHQEPTPELRVGVAFEQPLSKELSLGLWKRLRVLAVIATVLTIAVILFIKYLNWQLFWFDTLLTVYSLGVGAYLLSRFALASLYKSPVPRTELPSLTVVVPARNEQDNIERCLRHILEADYPGELLQLIAVNDGSDDDTLALIRATGQRYPELEIIDFEQGKGKRDAMAAGARRASGEIVVFVDSDSFLREDALRHIVDNFQDEDVAAVCGHCEVENEWTNLLTKMQAVRYYIGFRIMKGAESIFDCVTCLSGPIAAYRRSDLLAVLDDWLEQSFLGTQATFGDDRSLTNFLLRTKHVRYDSRARTRTIVPDRYVPFLKQQMRWKRSWFRESVRASGFMWRKPPAMSLSFYVGLLLPLLAPLIVFRAMVWVPLVYGGSPLPYVFGIFLMSAMMSASYLYAKRSRLWIYGVGFCFFYMFLLVWQLPWAMLTYWVARWGTRG